TLDSATQQNMVVWEKQNNFEIQSFNIYREGSVVGQFDSIGNVLATNDGKFIDQAAVPNQQSYKYTMSAVDSCGHTTLHYLITSSALVHQTIHLAASQGLGNEVNLTWNPYIGFSYNTFYIYRGSSATTLQILDSVSATTYAYTDYTAQEGLNYYRVTAKKQG